MTKTEYMRQWRAKNRDKVRAINKRYYEGHKVEHNAKSRAYHKRNRESILEKMHGSHIRRRFRLERASVEVVQWYKELLASQNGACAICLRPPMKWRLSVDHIHGTETIRGLLCARCNRAIGLLWDDPVMFDRAAAYLRKFQR